MSTKSHPTDRFNKPSKELLVEMINKFNGVRLEPGQLVFGTPTLLQGDGLTSIPVKFRSDMGWSDEEQHIRYFRIEANRHPELRSLVVHSEYVADSASLLKLVFDQCGVVLEPDVVIVKEIYGGLEADQYNLSTRIATPHLTGFNTIIDEPWRPDPELDRNFRITFADEHLLYFGHLHVMVRPALVHLGQTIAKRMDFRAFYQDGNLNRPPVDIYLPKGRILVGEGQPDPEGPRSVEAYLYEQQAGPILAVEPGMAVLLTSLTGDSWVSQSGTVTDFNIYNSTILYNGLVSSQYSTDDPRYGYVMAIELGDACRNLSGLLRIGYRYSSSVTPANRQYNLAGSSALFNF